MATVIWSDALYPLIEGTAQRPQFSTAVDDMDDGTLHVRVLSTDTFNTISVEVIPLSATESASFYSYLVTNRANEILITINTKLIFGYIDGNSVTKQIRNGLHYWKFRLKGKLL